MKEVFPRLKKASMRVWTIALKRWYLTLIIFGALGYFNINLIEFI
jgi:hypothetical protein